VNVLEEVKDGLEKLQIFKEYPILVNKNKELEKKVKDLSLEVTSLKEMNPFIDGKATTLPQLRNIVAKIKADEIKAEATNLFNGYKLYWEKNEKSSEVNLKACIILNSIIEQLKKSPLRTFLAEAAELELPRKIEEILKTEVEARRDAEFDMRVEKESESKASVKLEQKMSVEWPNWLTNNVEPKIRTLEEAINTNALSLLKGPWPITCDKCGQIDSREITPKGIEMLLKNRYLEIECENPSCIDVPLLKLRHKLKISLEDLISTSIIS